MSKLMDYIRPLKMTGYVYEASRHTGWGNRIGWSNYEKRRIDGHLRRRPRVGDEIRFEMESGKTARFAVKDVDYMRDPSDMFFATVMDIGYLGEKPINRVKEAKKQCIEPRDSGLGLFL